MAKAKRLSNFERGRITAFAKSCKLIRGQKKMFQPTWGPLLSQKDAWEHHKLFTNWVEAVLLEKNYRNKASCNLRLDRLTVILNFLKDPECYGTKKSSGRLRNLTSAQPEDVMGCPWRHRPILNTDQGPDADCRPITIWWHLQEED